MASADILRAAHTELPWEVYPGDPQSVYAQNGEVLVVDPGDELLSDGVVNLPDCFQAKANAAFIVRACNAHYQMLEALKSARDQLRDLANDIPAAAWLTDETYAECSTLGAIDAAIAAAEAEAGR